MNQNLRQERVTLKRVAEVAGVHPATVSRALNPKSASLISEETRIKVQRAADELGYVPSVAARTLRDGRSGTVGIVVADIANPYTGRIIRGVENTLEGRGIMALIAETQDDPDRMAKVISHLLERSVDGIVCTGVRAGAESLMKRTFDRVPVVLVDRTIPGSGLPTVAPDDILAGRIAAQHLLEQGHRRLMEVRGPDDISSFDLRSRGFTEAVSEASLELLDPGESAARPTSDQGYEVMSRALASGLRPTAVFAHNDFLALGVLKAIRDHGMECPAELSLVGCDDLAWTEHITPPLTTVNLPGYQLGRAAADVAVAMAEDPTHDPLDLTITPRLTVRASTASVPT